MQIRLQYVYRRRLIITVLSICLIIAIVSMRTPQDKALSPETINIAENMTKPLFSFIIPPEDLTFVSDMVQEKHPTFYPVGYSITGESICSQGSFSMLILIPSTSNHRQRRDTIRQTWASMVYQDLRNGYQTQNVRLAFFIGDMLLNDTEKHTLQEEAKLFNDIAVGNFPDTTRNLSIKVAHAISWADLNCGQAKFIAKVDDDVFLNIDLLLHILTLLPKTSSDFSLGLRNINDEPPVLGEDQRGNGESDYPFPYYIPYVLGYAYVLSRSAAQKVSKNFHLFHVITEEDAFINGVIAQSLSITRIHSNAFSNPYNMYSYCDVVFNRYLAFSVDTKILPSIWKGFRSKTCSDQDFLQMDYV